MALGIKSTNPNTEILIIAGTDIPQVFIQNNIEVIKLPSTKILFENGKQKLVPRYLKMDLSELFKLRQNIINVTFESFKPDIVLVEHNMTGQAWELAPIILEKWRNRKAFKLGLVSRGIIDSPKELLVNYTRNQHLLESIDVPNLYDHVFVMDNKSVIDYKKEYGFSDDFCSKITYHGLITAKNKQDLDKQATIKRLHLKNKKLILVTLGRIGDIEKIFQYVLTAFNELPKKYLLKIQLDLYLDAKIKKQIEAQTRNNPNIILSNFSSSLIEEINVADIVISRAGYNTVAEILLTNAKAILFPEVGRTEEEMFRSIKVSRQGLIEFFDERYVDYASFRKTFREVLKSKKADYEINLDNRKTAKQILTILGAKHD
ncbi:MAG: glycosyltransferase [archaeon]